MEHYTKPRILSSIEQALKELDEPIIPCRCMTWERCRCKENQLILQINKAYTILEDVIKPNVKRKAELDMLKSLQV